jgi:hypothetical protein
MRNIYIDLGYDFWNRGYMFRENHIGEAAALKFYEILYDNGTIKTLDEFFDWMLNNHSEMIYDYREADKKYREENEPKIREYFAKYIEGRTFNNIDPYDWEFYSDWHKDVFGYRPHGIVCGEYINPHA